MRQVTADAERLARELFFAPNVGNIAAIEKALAECAARARASAIEECAKVAGDVAVEARAQAYARIDFQNDSYDAFSNQATGASKAMTAIRALPLSPPAVCGPAPMRQAVFVEEVEGDGTLLSRWLVTLDCGHKKFTRAKAMKYACLECKSEVKCEHGRTVIDSEENVHCGDCGARFDGIRWESKP